MPDLIDGCPECEEIALCLECEETDELACARCSVGRDA